MLRTFAVVLLLVLTAAPPVAAELPIVGSTVIVGSTTVAEWHLLGESQAAIWAHGAMSALDMIGVRCAAPAGARTVAESMRARYLTGALKGTDRAMLGVFVVLKDHGCEVPPAAPTRTPGKR